MNEDDTYRLLRKIPFEDLRVRLEHLTTKEIRAEGFLESFGWTIEEVTQRLLDELEHVRNRFI